MYSAYITLLDADITKVGWETIGESTWFYIIRICVVAHVVFKAMLSVRAYTFFYINRKDGPKLFAASSLKCLVEPSKSVGISAEVIWCPLRQHLAQAGSSVLHPFWQNIWEWWRPLERIHGLASLKVECQRSLGGQPICQSGTATYSTDWMLVIEWHVSWVSKQRQAVFIACLRRILYIYITA